jgi:flagellar biosynthesis anti-sigma factor FlgM
MLVTNKNLQDVLQSYAQRVSRPSNAESGGRGQTAKQSSTTRRDAVELSSTAMDVRRALLVLQSSPDVRQDLVAALRKDIQSGDFQVNLEEIASQLSMVL